MKFAEINFVICFGTLKLNGFHQDSLRRIALFFGSLLLYSTVIPYEFYILSLFDFQTLDNGTNVIQLETAVGAAIKSFDNALGKIL